MTLFERLFGLCQIEKGYVYDCILSSSIDVRIGKLYEILQDRSIRDIDPLSIYTYVIIDAADKYKNKLFLVQKGNVIMTCDIAEAYRDYTGIRKLVNYKMRMRATVLTFKDSVLSLLLDEYTSRIQTRNQVVKVMLETSGQVITATDLGNGYEKTFCIDEDISDNIIDFLKKINTDFEATKWAIEGI
jgi:hypothetical protein